MEIYALLDAATVNGKLPNAGIHRNTVKHHLNRDAFPESGNRTFRVHLDPYRLTIRDYLDEEDYRATWIFRSMKKMGMPAVMTPSNGMSTLKEQKIRLAYARFETAPGFQANVMGRLPDSGGRRIVTTVYAFILVLVFPALYVNSSGVAPWRPFWIAISRPSYLKGVPAEILYDHMKT